MLAAVHRRAVRADHRVRLVGGDHARRDQAVGVQPPRARVLGDALVHERLRQQRLVGLVVPEAAEADEVDEHVAVEALPVLERDLDGEQRRLRVVAVDVQDRRLDHLGDVRAEHGAANVARIRRREADLVVDDDVDGAARVVAAGLRHVQAFLVDALPGDGGVAVDQDRQHLVAQPVAAPVLARAHRALDDRVHDLEVRRVERERQVHGAARRRHVGREPLVVLDVAGGQVLRDLALELREEVGGHLAQGVDEHVQAPAVGHAEHDLAHARRAGLLDQPVEHRDHRVAALAREALLADVLGVQVALERLGRGQPLEEVAALRRRVRRPRADRLQPLLEEALGRRVGDVHVLGAERARVGLLQRHDDVGQAHPRRPRPVRADVELGVHVRVGEAVRREVEVGHVVGLALAQRVEVRPVHAERAELVDHPQHEHLLVHRRRVDHRPGHPAVLRELDERRHHRRVRDVRRAAA